MQEQDLIDKLRKIERLHAGATTPGEREAAADAIARIKRRLSEVERLEKAIEYRFKLNDDWSKKLFIALLRRYGLKPYRYARQRRTTVMVRVPRSFVNETLWPQYLDLSTTLRNYLEDITNRVIAEGVHGDIAEEDIIAGDLPDIP
ncbi:MAG: hypothetical protein QE274_00915 [Verrucomicrobiaceae bacterium]|jgi:hypothetical protein|nr:hypothetical protein [Verrucomicrobiaceae bacterium]